MPQSGFTWLTEEHWSTLNWLAQRKDQYTGYFVQCDLEYPPDLHDALNDYPLAPERVAVTACVLSEKQVEVARLYSSCQTQKDVKLLPSLLNKVRYVTLYLNLKFYIEHGMKLTKIQRVIQFQQSRWLQPTIAMNTNLRAAAKSLIDLVSYPH